MVEFNVHDRGRYLECDLPQRSPEWLALRLGKITGSNFGAAAGVNQYKKPRQLQRDFKADKPFQGNGYTRHGNYWEAHAIEEYKRVTGIGVREMGFAVSKAKPFIGVSPDGILVDDTVGEWGLLEVKCPATKVSYEGVPTYYMAQIQGVMAVLGLRVCHFVVYRPPNFGGSRFETAEFLVDKHEDGVALEPNEPWNLEVWEVPLNKAYCKALFLGLEWFWAQCVLGVEIPTKRSRLPGHRNPHTDALEAVELDMKLIHNLNGGTDELKED